jgi:NCAIR mutase (PurE)-related protein
MNTEILTQLLENVKNGKVSIDDAVRKLKKLPFEDVGFAKVDHHRAIRSGYPEVIYCEGKTIEQIKIIVEKLMEGNNSICPCR